ncbi:MAG: hypothetical protein JO250_14515 [Armatimonadetes bacterium]|nr:hypothetical protein [Armatimonadota bacterium]
MPITRIDRSLSLGGQQEHSAAELRFDHLERLLTDIGLWQHTAFDEPDPRHGYSIDDEARGLIVGLRHWQRDTEPAFNARMAATCFEFIRRAALAGGDRAGYYHNFCDAQEQWLDSIGSEDSFGRTLWGLGVAHQADAPFAPRREADALMTRSLPRMDALHFLRSKAFCLLGLAYSRLDDARLRRLAGDLCDAYDQTASDDWCWFEDGMTYCNARLPHALFVAAGVFPQETRWARIATESLDFLLKVTRNGKGGYSPVGNARLTNGWWFARGEKRPPLFDQQPVDAGVLAEACAEAYRVTGEPRFRQAARDAFGWYFGLNVHGLPTYNPATGGVADAVTRSGLNRNQGAESALSLHLARQALRTIE